MDTLWHFRLFGTLEARQETRIISRFATSRVAALLARLALLPHRAHSREELAGLLWPDADAEAGRLNLRVALLALRRQMEPPGCPPGSILVTDRTSIRLHPQICTSDVAEFEAALREAARSANLAQKREKLDQALLLCEGELLPGFYDEWVLEERERLLALCEDAKTQRRALSPDPASLSSQPDPPAASGSLHGAALINFPGQFTRFFGRAAEQERLSGLLADPEVRLVTLLGPGGSGKTRLAAETARLAAGGFDGLVCFVALADISDGALIPSTIATALRLPLSGNKPPREEVAAHCNSASPAPVRSLLVLDNLEHLGEDGAAEIGALLEAAPRLTCLATSRQKLHLAGEHEVLLAPLPVPDSRTASDSHAASGDETPELTAAFLAGFPGVQLFVDRAQSVRPDFQVTPQNAAAIAAVCGSLEGLPLALELAAARIQALSPEQMRQQLAARLGFLTSRRRDLPPRHRSLRAALEWSAHLLSPEQTHFFSHLSVFRGGWTLEAAAAVCKVSAPLDLLEQLCERSLIASEESPRGMRFRMLESLREFGEEQLSPPERQALARRHAGYFQQLAMEKGKLWYGPEQNAGLETLSADYDNLRAALSFCRGDLLPDWNDARWNGADTGLRLAAALGDYWTTRGMMREGLDWLDGALLGGGDPPVRAAALAQAGWIAAGLSNFAQASAALTESITLSRRLGDDAALTLALRLRGTAFIWKGDFEDAETDLEEALALCRMLGNDRLLGATLNSLGVLANERSGDNVRAKECYEEALPLLLKVGDRQRASYCLHNLGNIAHDNGESTRAVAQLRHSLALASELGDEWHRAYCLRSLGDVFLSENDLAEAASLLEEGSALCARLGDKMTEAGTRQSLARVRRRQEQFAKSDLAALTGLRLYQSLGRTEGVTESWMLLAETAAAQNDWSRAAALLSAADACRAGFPNDSEQRRADTLHRSACAALSSVAFAAAWTKGRTLTCDDYGLR